MEEPTIALIAHDAKKADMVRLVQAHREELVPLATNLATAEAVMDVISAATAPGTDTRFHRWKPAWWVRRHSNRQGGWIDG